jgi:hypothetical protein
VSYCVNNSNLCLLNKLRYHLSTPCSVLDGIIDPEAVIAVRAGLGKNSLVLVPAVSLYLFSEASSGMVPESTHLWNLEKGNKAHLERPL